MNEKPKLLIVVDTYYPKIDGTLKFVEEFTKRANRDFDYHLLVPNFEKKKDTKEITFIGVSKIIKSSGYASIKLFSFKNYKKIINQINQTDTVFVQGPAMLSAIAIVLGRIKKKKVVFYMHVNLWDFFKKFLITPLTKILYFFMKPLMKRLGNLSSLVIAPYQELKEELVKRGVKTPIKVARLGVDIEKFSPSKDKAEQKKKCGLNPNKKVIGYVGRISNEKNINILMEAFQKLPAQSNLQLLMVGDGNPELVKKLKELKNCKVTGFVDNVEKYIKAMDIFVMPSLTETTSLATLEAMSCGLPVIATKVGFIKNYLIRNHNGIFFPRNSSTMLAIKIEKLLKNEELMERLGRNARKTVAYSFSWERSINKIVRIILE
ncbi:glycosyltransferase family 4 protein [Candidatus Woesearchaeota archaeon]|jgi:glycosyltransferase involved in cell wall biosynthesis|nr:glycosyltransferase family 4 protein [Candidatus Woesearchaeota archaeon]MBT4336398.1 glycosyltransferase family 4 protein [Candidatus Woesearchaeota archaeon]MBT4469947.1 glycosyltransferase family 4 protein [Candidatus Woesearchaeota archaeon]MBT6744329.1 glycosyltransferase family 4 protein [Candidatus Woesearchaeota archaeon]